MKFGRYLSTLGVIFLLLVIGRAPASAKEIRIGVLYPLSGGLAATGADLKAGVELARDIINNKMSGIDIPMASWEGIPSLGGAKIKLIFADHRSNPTHGADLAKRLIIDEKVVGLLGCYNSSVTKTVSAVAERYGVPMINGSSTSPALTQRGFKWFWRTTPHDKWFTKDLFELLKGLTEGKVKGVKAVPKSEIMRIASACENTEWGSHVSNLIDEFAKQYGFTMVKAIKYPHNSPDLTSEVQALKAANPDVMLFASYLSDAILMVKTLKSLKATPKIIWGQDAGFEQADFRKALGDDIVGILTRTVFIPKVAKVKKVAGQVNALFKERTGHDLTGASGRSFTGLQAWAYVLNKAGSTDPKAIQKAANEIVIPGEELVMPWAGIYFRTVGNETGQNVFGSGLIGQYQRQPDGSVDLEVIYPFDVATAPMIFPFPGYK